jgi:iron(III) transport system permease protein
VIPIAWLGIRYPHRIFRMLEGCIYITSSLPGIVTALALVTVTIHARPIYQTEITLFLAYLLMFMPRALINLRAGLRRRRLSWKTWRAAWQHAREGALERHDAAGRAGCGGGGRAGFPRRQQRVDRHAAALRWARARSPTGFWALTSEIDYVAAAPYAMLMILISLPLTAILYMQSKKIAGL